MLIYDAHSPAPRCLRMFLLEKRLQLPAVTVDVMTGENRQPAYLTVNPAGQTPVLRLNDGSILAEAVAIAEYLEELYPLPILIGNTPRAARTNPTMVATGGAQYYRIYTQCIPLCRRAGSI